MKQEKLSMQKIKKISICLTLIIMLLGHTVVAAASEITKASTDEAMDISKDWSVVTWLPGVAGTAVEDIFKQGINNAATDEKSVVINEYNLRKTTFSAVKKVPMKKGVTYQVKFNYYMQTSGVDFNKTYISINGKKITEATTLAGKEVAETITPTQDMSYDIEFHFVTLDANRSHVFQKISFAGTSGGIIEDQLKAPQVNPAYDTQTEVTGFGNTVGDTILVKDSVNGSPGNLLGSAQVENDKSYTVTTNRGLRGDEELYVYEQTPTGAISVPTKLTVLPLAETLPMPVPNQIVETQTRITGTALAGTQLIILDANQQQLNGVDFVKADGTFDASISRPMVLGEVLTLYVRDNQGHRSPMNAVTVEGVPAISAPNLAEVTDVDTEIKGSGQANLTVDLKLYQPDGTVSHFAKKIDATGNFIVNLNGHTYPVGTRIVAYVSDGVNQSPETEITVVSSKKLSADFETVTSISTTFIGKSAVPNATYTLTIGDQIISEGITDQTGTIQLTLPETYPIGTPIALLVEKDGKTALKEDVIRPRMPTVTNLIAASSRITGTGDPTAEIKVKINQTIAAQTTVSATGDYLVQLTTPLAIGDVVEIYQEVNGYESEHILVRVNVFTGA